MATNSYMAGRKKWYRPQAMLWSDTVGTLSNGFYIPSGYEYLSDPSQLSAQQLRQYEENKFIILSDHNRAPISIATNRIEQKTRMANGTMRSYHIADKLSLSVAWSMLPSRSFSTRPDYDQTTGQPNVITSALVDHDNDPTTPNQVRKITTAGSKYLDDQQYTVDGGAGGAELLQWYEDHTGPFWVFLSYDKFTNFGDDSAAYQNLNKYNEILQMQIADFNYSIVKRGQRNFDMWDISVTLEEV